MPTPNDVRQLRGATDYLIVTSDDGHPGADREANNPAGWDAPIDLGGGVELRAFSEADGDPEELLRSCEPRGLGFEPARQWGPLHAYVREVTAAELDGNVYAWDPTGDIYVAMCLSRLVRDNASTSRYAIRRLYHSQGPDVHVPGHATHARLAFRLDPARRGWLDDTEAGQLATLLEHFRARRDDLPKRISEGLRSAEAAAREYYAQDMQALVVRALDGMTSTDRGPGLRRRFCARVPQLSREVGVRLGGDVCDRAYRDRSTTYHGAVVNLGSDATSRRFRSETGRLFETLRRSVRRAIEDPTFAAVFEDDAAIDARWPV